jgi:hypothetical protein
MKVKKSSLLGNSEASQPTEANFLTRRPWKHRTVTQRVTRMLSGVEFESVSNTAHHVSFPNQMSLVHILKLLYLSQYRALLPLELKFYTYKSSPTLYGTYSIHIYHPHNVG